MRWILISVLICLTLHISCGENVSERDHLLDVLQSLNKKLTILEESNLETMETIAKLETENTGLRRQVDFMQRNLHVEKTELSSSGQSDAPGQIKRSCAEYFKSDPNLDSGTYVIDPDGIGSGDPPFEAYCDMSTGTTMISHDSETPTNVTVCPSAGCYDRKVVYDATDRQIKALEAISVGCRQKIQYDCLLAPIQFSGIDYCYWSNEEVATDTSKFNYWSGNGQLIGQNKWKHTCRCGELGNCVDSSLTCNCDAYLPELYSDAGYLTNTDHLPVKSLYFGRVSSTSQATYTLGKMECYGQGTVNGHATSCEDLWKLGQFLSGIYTFQKDGATKFVYCNMEHLFEDGFETDVNCPLCGAL